MININNEAIEHLKTNIKTKLGVSPINGIGVFAIKDIKKDEQVFPIWEGESFMYIILQSRIRSIYYI